MDDKSKTRFCTVDHAGKQADQVGFDPYQFWLKQARRESLKPGETKDAAEDRNTDGNGQ